MTLLFTMLLLLHGIAHGVGFAVPWRLIQSPGVRYGTTLVSGRVDVGAVGIRIVGVLWLLTGLAFIATAVGMWMGMPNWSATVGVVAGVSLVLCLLAWPDARIGVLVNLLILVALALGTA